MGRGNEKRWDAMRKMWARGEGGKGDIQTAVRLGAVDKGGKTREGARDLLSSFLSKEKKEKFLRAAGSFSGTYPDRGGA